MEGNVKTFGGLIIVQLGLKDKKLSRFEGKVELSYMDRQGQKHLQSYPVLIQKPEN